MFFSCFNLAPSSILPVMLFSAVDDLLISTHAIFLQSRFKTHLCLNSAKKFISMHKISLPAYLMKATQFDFASQHHTTKIKRTQVVVLHLLVPAVINR